MDKIQKVSIVFTDNADATKANVDNLNQSIDQTAVSTTKATQATAVDTKTLGDHSTAVLENGGAMGLLNDLTGGYAMMVKDAVEASALFISKKKIDTVVTEAQTVATVSSNTSIQLGILSKIKDAATWVASTAAKAASTVATNIATAAQWLWNTAILANPLVAFVVAIVAAAAGIYKFTSYLISSSKEADKNAAALKKHNEQLKELKRNQDILEKDFDRYQDTERKKTLLLIENSEDRLKKAREYAKTDKDEAERQANATLSILKIAYRADRLLSANASDETKAFLKKDLLDKQKQYDEAKEIFTKKDEIYKDLKSSQELTTLEESIDAAKKAEDKKLKDQEDSIKKSTATAEAKAKAIADIEKKNKDAIADLNAKTDQEKLDLAKKRDLAEVDALNAGAETAFRLKSEINQKYNLLQADFDKKTAEDKKKAFDESNAYFAGEADNAMRSDLDKASFYNQQIFDGFQVTHDKRKEALDAEQQLQQEAYDKGIISKEEFVSKSNELNQKQRDNDDALAQHKMDNAESYVRIAQSLAGFMTADAKDTKKKQAQALKANAIISLGAIGIDTAKGIMAETSKGYPAAIPGIIAVGLAGVLQTVNLKKSLDKSLAQLGEGGGGISAAAPSASSTPNVKFVASSENQLASSINRKNALTPIKAYVVSQDVTTAQAMDRNAITTTSVG